MAQSHVQGLGGKSELYRTGQDLYKIRDQGTQQEDDESEEAGHEGLPTLAPYRLVTGISEGEASVRWASTLTSTSPRTRRG